MKSRSEKAQFKADSKVCRLQKRGKKDSKGFWKCMNQLKAERRARVPSLAGTKRSH